jgi:hypothetical protein
VLLLTGACGGVEATVVEPGPSYSGVKLATEFVVGPNRFPFGVMDIDGALLDEAQVTVRFVSLNEADDVFLEQQQATWRTVRTETSHIHDDGGLHTHLDFRGLYVVDEITFPEPGIWAADFAAVSADGSELRIERTSFQVLSEPVAPGIGERVPATRNLTIHDVDSFAEISTRAVERDELHNVSVAFALASRRPFVVFFASPQFCTSAMCGPVTDTLDAARTEVGGAVEFIHIEPWDLQAAREQGTLMEAPVMGEWGLPTEPWTFVVGSDGRVVKRFEGLVAVDEVVAALAQLL